jgi:hypothetical protein
MVLELAKKGGVLLSGEREATRTVAIEVLGELSRSHAVAQALDDLTHSRWGTSEDIRSSASQAARSIQARLREGGPAA